MGFLIKGLANEAMDKRKSWITSSTAASETDNDDDDGDKDDDVKDVAVSDPNATLSKKEVINVYDSDNDSTHSC